MRAWSNISTWKFVQNQLKWWYLPSCCLNATSFQALKGPRPPHSSVCLCGKRPVSTFLKTRSETLSKFCERPFKVQQIGGGNSNIFGIFAPTWQPGEMMHFDEHIFQMGWRLKPPTRQRSEWRLGVKLGVFSTCASQLCVFKESIAPQRRCHYRVNLTSVRLLGAILKIYLVPWINNFFNGCLVKQPVLCSDLESSNWNNHKQLVVWSFRYMDLYGFKWETKDSFSRGRSWNLTIYQKTQAFSKKRLVQVENLYGSILN